MATQLQLRRGTSQQIDNFIGAESELIANTETYELTVHDGITKGGHVVLGENRVSNCITEIPQDIKLELTSTGILTLKAGSKVYVPNGAGVFDVYTVASDISRTFSVSNDKILICLDIDNLTMPANRIQNCTSGTTPPSDSGMFYDTNANTIRSYTSGTPNTHKISFPFAQLSFDSGGNCTIDQVFNGYGYIGSTVFALPGVKGLAPNDRNADKTLKSVVIAPNSVITRTFTATGALYIGLQSNSFGGSAKSNYSYDPNTNIQYSSGTAFSNSVVFASCDMSSGVISNWTVLKNNPFHAVDYSDTEYMAHQSTPSDKYIDLTPMSGIAHYYVAPGDGYFSAYYRLPDSNNHLLTVYATDSTDTVWLVESSIVTNWTGPYVASGTISVIIRVRKGQKLRVSMFNEEIPTGCRFIYDNGSK